MRVPNRKTVGQISIGGAFSHIARQQPIDPARLAGVRFGQADDQGAEGRGGSTVAPQEVDAEPRHHLGDHRRHCVAIRREATVGPVGGTSFFFQIRLY